MVNIWHFFTAEFSVIAFVHFAKLNKNGCQNFRLEENGIFSGLNQSKLSIRAESTECFVVLHPNLSKKLEWT